MYIARPPAADVIGKHDCLYATYSRIHTSSHALCDGGWRRIGDADARRRVTAHKHDSAQAESLRS